MPYVDPVLSVLDESELNSQTLRSLTNSFPNYYAKITVQCSQVLKVYKLLLAVQYKLNAWEFATLKHSINLNFNLQTDARKFDIKIAQKVLHRCQELDIEIDNHNRKISQFINFIQSLSVEEYISDPGTLLLKIYFKVLNLKNTLAQELSIAYTKAKLLVISYELGQIMEMMDQQENPVALDNTDFQSTLLSYKDFVSVLIDQLDRAVTDKDSDQIEECLGILNDVEKMYESVRMNFFISEELNEWEQEQEQYLLQNSSFVTNATEESSEEELYQGKQRSRRTSLSSTTSSLGASFSTFNRPHGTISEELPYLMQAFNEAKHLEQELSHYQPHIKSPLAKSPSSTFPIQASSTPTTPVNSTFMNLGIQEKRKSHLQAGFNTPNVGFQSSLLNNLYGLHPGKQPFAASQAMNNVD